MTPASQAVALFTSTLQPSDQPGVDEINAAICTSLQRNGGECGCQALSAAEYGEHPDTAAARMRWALSLIQQGGSFAVPAA